MALPRLEGTASGAGGPCQELVGRVFHGTAPP